jgi:hypothetical protein
MPIKIKRYDGNPRHISNLEEEEVYAAAAAAVIRSLKCLNLRHLLLSRSLQIQCCAKTVMTNGNCFCSHHALHVLHHPN